MLIGFVCVERLQYIGARFGCIIQAEMGTKLSVMLQNV